MVTKLKISLLNKLVISEVVRRVGSGCRSVGSGWEVGSGCRSVGSGWEVGSGSGPTVAK